MSEAEKQTVTEPEPSPEPAPAPAASLEPEPSPEASLEPEGSSDGEGLDALSAAMDDGQDRPEPPRHWLRWPGFVGALLVVAVVILVPCGGAVLYLTGAFADHGRFAAAPDACARLRPESLGDRLQVAMVVQHRDRSKSGTTCDYGVDHGTAAGAAGEVTAVLTIDSYGPKGPLSAARMAHAGLNGAVTDAEADPDARPAPAKKVVGGVGDEAVVLADDDRTVSVYARVSNLLVHLRLELSYVGGPGLSGDAVALTRQVTSGLR
jgi:hypothetical protein